MNNNHVYDMLVVGGGPGGYTAALYAARAGLDTVVLEKLSAGGQMALTEQIDNYPGFEDGIDGFSLAEKMQKQAERFGARSEYAEVLRMDLTAVPKLVETSEGIFRGKTVVLATGADPRTLGVAGETELLGRGVAYCAACDGMFYKGKTVVVVGGGNSAAADALLLSRVAKKVILVHRRDALRATKIYHEPLAQAENVEFRWNSTVSALLSGDRLTGVKRGGLRRRICQRGPTARHGAGGGSAIAGQGRLYRGRRDHGDQRSRRLRRGRCADEASPSGGHRRGGRRSGSPHGGKIYRGKPIREVD